jgi:hypothetical protein
MSPLVRFVLKKSLVKQEMNILPRSWSRSPNNLDVRWLEENEKLLWEIMIIVPKNLKDESKDYPGFQTNKELLCWIESHIGVESDSTWHNLKALLPKTTRDQMQEQRGQDGKIKILIEHSLEGKFADLKAENRRFLEEKGSVEQTCAPPTSRYLTVNAIDSNNERRGAMGRDGSGLEYVNGHITSAASVV